MADRARLSKRDTYGDGAASFLGSADFAPSLVQACRRLDPRAILFATDEPRWPDPAGSGWQAAMQQMLRARVAGKRVLACSGADDKLVPYRCSEPFLNFLGRAAVLLARPGPARPRQGLPRQGPRVQRRHGRGRRRVRGRFRR